MTTLLQLVVVGVMIGTLYGLLGVTLTLMFRSTGILSFAHAGFALIGAYMYSGFACPHSAGGAQCGSHHMFAPWVAAVITVATTTASALVVERLVIRPLQYADSTTKSIATAAVLGLASGLMLQVYGPTPRYVPQSQQLIPSGGFKFLRVVVEYQRGAILVISVLLVSVLAFVLKQSWFGLGVRAAGQRPDVVRLFGVRPVTTSRFNWALGGALSGLAGVLIAPVTVVNIGTFSFLLVKAVAAALLGGLISLPLTFVGGIGLGVVETILPHYFHVAGVSEVGVAGLIVATLVFTRRRLSSLTGQEEAQRRRTEPRGVVAVAIARFLASIGLIASRVPRLVWMVVGVAVVWVPLHSEFYGAVGLNVLFWALVTLSLVVPAGDGGQPSLIQISFVGVGAYTVTTGLAHHLPFIWTIPMAIAISTVLGLLVGAVILNFRGAAFAILSLTFAAVITDFLLAQKFVKSSVATPKLFSWDLLKSQHAFAVALVLAIVTFVVVYNFRRTALGTSYVSLRQGPRILSHFGANPRRMEILAFGMSAGIASCAGVAYALLVSGFSTFQFVPLLGIIALLAAFVGGLRSLWGPVIAGLIFGYGPTLAQHLSKTSANAYPQIASSLLALILVVNAPGGIASLFSWARDVLRNQPQEGVARDFRGVAVLPELFPDLMQPAPANGTRPRRLGVFGGPPRPGLRRANGRSRSPQPGVKRRERPLRAERQPVTDGGN